MAPFFGGLGDAPRGLSAQFVATAVVEDAALRAALPSGVRYLPVEHARGLTRADMVRNSRVPRVAVPPGDAPVTVDGVAVPVHEATALPLTRLHNLG
jgi:urease subunit alpha